MERNKKFTEASITDGDYLKLFEELTKCGEHAWVKKGEKQSIDLTHPKYPNYSRLDFRHLFKFLKGLVDKDKQRKKDFQAEIADIGITWDGFRQGQYRNLDPYFVRTGIYVAAEFLDIALIQLMADFLADCEDDGKKIRLAEHARYEKTIKNFIRDAPELVKRLEVESAQASTQEIQKQSPKQTATENRYEIDRVEGEEKWLDPYNFDELPLVCRDHERELLDKFIKADGQFKIWAISGPSGSGKTRLACQWAYFSKKLDGWDRRILHKEDRAEPKKWAAWIPDKPTLIIIDYLYGFEEVALKLLSRRLEPTVPKIRLLLIDHVFSEPLHSDKRWGFSGEGSSLNRNEKYFFDLKPLDLKETQDQEEIIQSIIARRAGIDHNNNQVKKAHEYLSNMKDQSAYHPLFAALVGDVIKLGKDFTVWNRRELIYYYLSGEKRLPWKHEELALNGRWASHFIAVATARRGVAYKELKKAAGKCKTRPEHFSEVKEICQKIVADKDTTTLKSFEPDILGESFFLKFIQFIEDSPDDYQPEFQQIFMAGDEGTQVKDAIALIAFIQRLTRNLRNDYLCQKETLELWNTLFDFMCPSNFENAEPIKWAFTAAIIDIVDEIQDQFPEERLITLLNQVDPVVFYRVKNSNLLRDSVLYSMRWFELTKKLTNTPPSFSEKMTELFERYTVSKTSDETPLILAIYYGLNEMANALIDRGADINTVDSFGKNPLHLASAYGQVEMVKLLLDKEVKIDAADLLGITALHWASSYGQVEVVKLLLDKEGYINAADYFGKTALHWASEFNQVEVVRLLVSKAVDFEEIQPRRSLIEAVFSMMLEFKIDIHATNNNGQTALSIAKEKGHKEIIKLLVDRGARR